jgi:hypothetical protein
LPFSYPCVLNPNNRTFALLFHVSSFIVPALAGHTSYPCILNINNHTHALLLHTSYVYCLCTRRSHRDCAHLAGHDRQRREGECPWATQLHCAACW